MPTLEEIQEKIKKLDETRLLEKMEIEALPEILGEDEELIRITAGKCKNKEGVVATNQRIFFYKIGIFKNHLEDFVYSQITSVRHKMGLALATLIILGSGNKIVIDDMYQTEVLAFTEFIRKQIAGGEKENTTTKINTDNNDTISQLERLAKLKEQGILTEEEFAQQKAKILN